MRLVVVAHRVRQGAQPPHPTAHRLSPQGRGLPALRRLSRRHRDGRTRAVRPRRRRPHLLEPCVADRDQSGSGRRARRARAADRQGARVAPHAAGGDRTAAAPTTARTGGEAMTALNRAVDVEDWVRGPADAPVTLLEYGDFECPFCGQAFWELKRLEQAVGDRVRFVFRHFPLAQAHPHARLAAEAAEAAGAQGKFWEMHDTLFANQRALELSDLLAYADDIGLD